MNPSAVARRAGVGAVAGLGVLLTAAPALAAADTSVSVVDESTGSSVAGQTLTVNTTLRVAGTGSTPGTTYRFTVAEPDGTPWYSASKRAHLAATGGPAQFSQDLATSGEPNGTWSVSISGGASADFTLAIPPGAVSGFSAQGDDNLVTLTWTANDEPDLVGYLITDPSGSSTLVHPGDAGCSSSSACSIPYQPSSSQQGKTLNFSIKAERNGGCGCAGSPVAGALSTAQVSLPAASPSPSPSSGGKGTGGGSGGKGTGSGSGKGSGSGVTRGGNFLTNGKHSTSSASGRASRRAGLQPFRSKAALNLPVPNLPGFSIGNLPTAALPGGEGAGAAQQSGGYKPTLAYPPGKSGGDGTVVSGNRSVTSSLLHVINQQALWRSLGLAAIFLLGATHLLLWLRRAPAEL